MKSYSITMVNDKDEFKTAIQEMTPVICFSDSFEEDLAKSIAEYVNKNNKLDKPCEAVGKGIKVLGKTTTIMGLLMLPFGVGVPFFLEGLSYGVILHLIGNDLEKIWKDYEITKVNYNGSEKIVFVRIHNFKKGFINGTDIRISEFPDCIIMLSNETVCHRCHKTIENIRDIKISGQNPFECPSCSQKIIWTLPCNDFNKYGGNYSDEEREKSLNKVGLDSSIDFVDDVKPGHLTDLFVGVKNYNLLRTDELKACCEQYEAALINHGFVENCFFTAQDGEIYDVAKNLYNAPFGKAEGEKFLLETARFMNIHCRQISGQEWKDEKKGAKEVRNSFNTNTLYIPGKLQPKEQGNWLKNAAWIATHAYLLDIFVGEKYITAIIPNNADISIQKAWNEWIDMMTDVPQPVKDHFTIKSRTCGFIDSYNPEKGKKITMDDIPAERKKHLEELKARKDSESVSNE